jgi:hypothetical protein
MAAWERLIAQKVPPIVTRKLCGLKPATGARFARNANCKLYLVARKKIKYTGMFYVI